MNEIEGPAEPRARGWRRFGGRRALIAALALSVALNLFGAGWLGARWFAFGGWVHAVHDRPEIEELWRANAGEFKRLRGVIADSVRGAADELSAEPYQPEAFAAAVREVEAQAAAALAFAGGVAAEAADQLEPDERAWVAERARKFARQIERRGSRRGRDH